MAASPSEPDTATKTLADRLAEARANLAAAATLGDAGLTNAPAGVSPQDISVRRAGLQRLVRLYEQQLSDVAELEATKTRKAEIAREAQAWTRFDEPPPYSILLTDRLREELQTERQKISNGEAAGAALEQIIEENRQTLAQAEERIRQFNEQLEGAIPSLPLRSACPGSVNWNDSAARWRRPPWRSLIWSAASDRKSWRKAASAWDCSNGNSSSRMPE